MKIPPSALALAALLAGGSASAASFDCGQAKRPLEVAICAKPTLSRLDERLSQAYQQALKALSAEGAAGLKTSQLSWLRYVQRVCVRPGADGAIQAEGDCIEQEMKRRLAQLATAAVPVGPFLLTRVDRYEAVPAAAGDDTGHRSGRVVSHVGYPQLEGGAGKAAAWNRTQVEKFSPPSADDATDVDSDFSLACAGDEILSLRKTGSDYAHGSPHGLYALSALTVMLQPAIRPLAPGDLFAVGAPWRQQLPDLAWQAYLRSEYADSDNEEMQRTIRAAAADVARWLVTPRGLEVGFSAYEGGSYAGTPAPVTVPWSALRPLLGTKGAPACRAGS